MKLKVRLFGPFADAARDSSVDVLMSGEDELTAGQVKTSLARQYPKLRGMLGPAVLAVNHQAVRPDHVICETDELAIIGLVSGG